MRKKTMTSPLKVLQISGSSYCSSPFSSTRKIKGINASKLTTRCSGTDKDENSNNNSINNNDSDDNNKNNNNNRLDIRIRVNDMQLILGEVSLLWILELISRAVQVSLSPDFPGWLAPIESPTANSIASMVSATAWNFTWIGFSAIVGAYEQRDHDCSVVEKGNTKTKTPTMKTLEQVSLAMFFYAPAQAFGDALSLHVNLLNLAATPPLLIRIPTTFAFIFAFRFYVLYFRGEVDREIEESEFQLLYATLSVSLLTTLCGAFTQTVHPQFHIDLAREIFEMVE